MSRHNVNGAILCSSFSREYTETIYTVTILFTALPSDWRVRGAFDINELPRSILLDKDLRVLDNHFSRASNLRNQDIDNLLSRFGGKQ